MLKDLLKKNGDLIPKVRAAILKLVEDCSDNDPAIRQAAMKLLLKDVLNIGRVAEDSRAGDDDRGPDKNFQFVVNIAPTQGVEKTVEVIDVPTVGTHMETTEDVQTKHTPD